MRKGGALNGAAPIEAEGAEKRGLKKMPPSNFEVKGKNFWASRGKKDTPPLRREFLMRRRRVQNGGSKGERLGKKKVTTPLCRK